MRATQKKFLQAWARALFPTPFLSLGRLTCATHVAKEHNFAGSAPGALELLRAG